MQPLMLFSLQGFVTDNKGLLITLFIGAVAGILAQLFTAGKGFGMLITILLGIAGGWLGSMLFKNYLALTNNPLINQIICATAGAMILCIIINLILGKRGEDRDRSDYESGR